MQLQLAPPYEGYREELMELINGFSKNGELIQDARNQIKVFKWSKGDLVIKSFKKPHLINQFVYGLLRDSKAKKSFDNSFELIKRKIGVPAPIGYSLESKNHMLQRSFFISEKFSYDFTFHDTFYKRVELSQALLKSFATFAYEVHSKGVLHLDFTPGNILIKAKGEDFLFGLVDVNRMVFGAVSLKQGCENLGKLFFEEEHLLLLSKYYAEKHNCSEEIIYKWISSSHDRFIRNKKIKNIFRGRVN